MVRLKGGPAGDIGGVVDSAIEEGVDLQDMRMCRSVYPTVHAGGWIFM